MKCFNCKAEVEEDASFCPECGITILQINQDEPFVFVLRDPITKQKTTMKLKFQTIDSIYTVSCEKDITNVTAVFNLIESNELTIMEQEKNHASNNDRHN